MGCTLCDKNRALSGGEVGCTLCDHNGALGMSTGDKVSVAVLYTLARREGKMENEGVREGPSK